VYRYKMCLHVLPQVAIKMVTKKGLSIKDLDNVRTFDSNDKVLQ